MKRLFLVLFTMMTGLAFTGAAYGATESGTMNISTNIVVACTVSTAAVNFGTDTGSTSVTANGSIMVKCSNGAAYNIALDKGLNVLIAGSRTLRPASGTDAYIYLLYQNSALSTQWGDSDFANTFSLGASKAGTGNGSEQILTVYGKRMVGSGTGTFSDTVVVTINF